MTLLFEDFKVIICLGETLTFGWVITIVTVNNVVILFQVDKYNNGNVVYLSLPMCKSCSVYLLIHLISKNLN